MGSTARSTAPSIRRKREARQAVGMVAPGKRPVGSSSQRTPFACCVQRRDGTPKQRWWITFSRIAGTESYSGIERIGKACASHAMIRRPAWKTAGQPIISESSQFVCGNPAPTGSNPVKRVQSVSAWCKTSRRSPPIGSNPFKRV